LDSAKLEFQRDEIQRDELSRSLRFAQSALTDAESPSAPTKPPSAKKNCATKLPPSLPNKALLTQRQTDFDRSLAAELTDAKKLKKFLAADKLEIPPALNFHQRKGRQVHTYTSGNGTYHPEAKRSGRYTANYRKPSPLLAKTTPANKPS
jgi:hypothetical protein